MYSLCTTLSNTRAGLRTFKNRTLECLRFVGNGVCMSYRSVRSEASFEMHTGSTFLHRRTASNNAVHSVGRTNTVTHPSVWHRVRCADAEVWSLLVSAVPAFRRRCDPSKRRNCTPDTTSSRTRLTTCIESLGPKDFYRVHNGPPRSLSWARSVYFRYFILLCSDLL